MRLAILIPSFEKGGIERSISRIARELIKLGWRIDLLVIEVNPEMRNLIQGTDVVYLSRAFILKLLKFLPLSSLSDFLVPKRANFFKFFIFIFFIKKNHRCTKHGGKKMVL